MSLSIGIVGLPNVGKSTLFNALTKKGVPAENYPFCTIDPAVGVVAVPDKRLWQLAEFSQSKKVIPAAIEFVDIAGLIKGASKGEGLGNQFLSHIREVDAILEIVRIFEDDKVIHVENSIDPLRDIETINLELIFADLESAEKQKANLGRAVKQGDKESIVQDALLDRVISALNDGKLALSVAENDEEKILLKRFGFLTAKPILYGLNQKTGGRNLPETNPEAFTLLTETLTRRGDLFLLIDAKIEGELSLLAEDDKALFREELGAEDDGIDTLIKRSYELLGLSTFFTTGPDETRGWTIKNGSSAPEAGAAIHSDFKEKFIRAEVIHWDVLLSMGSYSVARENGLLRTEGRDYIVKDGDVIEFKI